MTFLAAVVVVSRQYIRWNIHKIFNKNTLAMKGTGDQKQKILNAGHIRYHS